LHPDGDAIIVVPSRKLSTRKEILVSSTVLSLASDYFKALFQSNFIESSEIRKGICPEIRSEDDDPEAMEVLLSILHFWIYAQYEKFEPKTLLTIPIQCDKYDCIRALKPWISVWLSPDEPQETEEPGLLLSAAHLFRASDCLQIISKAATRQVSLETAMSWPNQELMTLMPSELKASIIDMIQALLRQLYEILQVGEEALRRDPRGHKISGLVCCLQCRSQYSETTKTCYPCGVNDFYQAYCTNQSRLSEYLAIMRHNGLRPSVAPFQTFT
ncbi:hypothetical protein B0I35DRAFT_329428, partial [Stachybotrys elegans]